MAELINRDDSLNDGREKLNNAIKAFNETVVEGDSSVEAAQARVDAQGQTFQTLKHRLDTKETDFSSQLAQKANYTDVRLATVKLSQADMTDELLQQMAGTTPINAVVADNGVTRNKLAPNSVTKGKLSFDPIEGVRGKNLFDKNEIVADSYIHYQTGAVNPSSGFSVSDYIRIEPNIIYTPTTNYQMAFYDINANYISGLGIDQYTTISTPANAVFLRVTVRNTDLDIYQLEKGTLKTDYEDWYTVLPERMLDRAVREKVNKPDYLIRVLNHLENPFIKTKIVLIGDSITAGAGGTGYSTTQGEPIGTSGEKTNNASATCWANMLVNHVNDRYNRNHLISPINPEIKDTTRGVTSSVPQYFNLCLLQWRKMFHNLPGGVGLGIKLEFYGEKVEVFYMEKNNTGIFEVLVDGVSKGLVDTYATATSYNNSFVVDGLTKDYHIIEVVQTGTKNIASTKNEFYIEGFSVPKSAEVKNYGISGKTSEYFYVNRDKIIPSDTDILIMQLGTNDRKTASPDVLKTYQREIIKYAYSLGSQVILMSSIPSSVEDENQAIRIYKMNDVNTAIRQLADEFNMPYISNYQFYIDFTRTKGITIESLLKDGLHPNDEGHRLIFENIARHLGLSIVQDGITYN